MMQIKYTLCFLALLLSDQIFAQEQRLLAVKSDLVDVVQDEDNLLWYLDKAGRLYRHNSVIESRVEGVPRFQSLHAGGTRQIFACSKQAIWTYTNQSWSLFLTWPHEAMEQVFFNDLGNSLVVTSEYIYSVEDQQISQCREQRLVTDGSTLKPIDAEYIGGSWYILDQGKARRICTSNPRTIVSPDYFVDLLVVDDQLGLVKENRGPFIFESGSLRQYFADSSLVFPSVSDGAFLESKYVSIDPYEVKVLAKNSAIQSRIPLSEPFKPCQTLEQSILGFNSTGVVSIESTQSNDKPSTTITRITLSGQPITDLQNTIEISGKSAPLELDLESVYWGKEQRPAFYYRAPPKVDTWQEWDALKSLRITIDDQVKSVELQQVFDNRSTKLLEKPLQFKVVEEVSNLPWLVAFSSLGLLLLGTLFAARGIAESNARHQERIQTITLQKQFAEEQLKSMQLQMNPHFLFNVLNSIQGLITIGEYKQAKTSLNAFAQLMRSMLNNSSEQSIKLEEEVSLLTKYLSLEQICRPDKFDFVFDIDEEVDKNILIPSMIIQPFVENAIIHGIRWKTTIGKISIRFSKHPKGVKCEVVDDGIGRKAAAEKKESTHKSLGLSIVKQRLSTYFRFSEGLDSVQFKDLYDSNEAPIGTQVTIILPRL